MALDETCCCYLDTPLGKAVAAADGGALTGFWFIGQKYYPKSTEKWTEKPEEPVFEALRNWIDGYFAGENPVPGFVCAPRGTEFQKAVWDILLKIPYGRLTTYGAIAKRMAERQGAASMSAQAVGGAVGHNPISLVIPCHRVVGANGSLTGYAGGVEKKEALLRLEGALLR
jgi:methylated-DNA-[protein]-cysteine S-methyltransferase